MIRQVVEFHPRGILNSLLGRCLLLFIFVEGLGAQTPGSGCAWDRAIQLHQAGDLAGAIREYQSCIVAEPARIEARSNLGAAFSRLGRYQEAIDQYREALKTAPPEVAPHLRFNLALAYYKSDQIPQATAELEALHRLQPTDFNIALLLADCELRTGRFREVIDMLLPLEASHTGEAALDYVLGMALIRDGRPEQGQLRVDRILSRGESAEGHFLLGSVPFMAHDYPTAAREFSKAAAIDPTVPSLQSYLGQALLFTGDAEGAAAAFRKELDADPNDYEANFLLASILARRGKTGEAQPFLERAVQIRPASGEARDALAHGFRYDAQPPATGGVAAGSLAPRIGSLDLRQPARPIVLVFGSYTCPQLRGSAGALKALYAQFSGRVDFRLVYIREAHPRGGGWQSTINEREEIDLGPARDLTDKQAHANLCVRRLNIPFPALVDGMDGAAEGAYDAFPSRVYLVGRDGRVAFNSRLGELDFQPDQLAAAMRASLAKGGPLAGSR